MILVQIVVVVMLQGVELQSSSLNMSSVLE